MMLFNFDVVSTGASMIETLDNYGISTTNSASVKDFLVITA
jgi:hypothetical protein